MSAIVYLVGAGPGDPKLLTLRAKELLAQADAVIFDALVSDPIMGYCKPEAEKIFVGKRAGAHSFKQEDINEIIVATAQRVGGTIVRLKGGDPFVFGRGGEEMIALKDAGIGYEVVPGISAGIAAPAYFGIPVTHRVTSRSVSLITAATLDGGLPDLDWQMWARTDGTMAFYMGMRAVQEIAQVLVKHGMSPETPAAIVSQGTLPAQAIVLHTLGHFASSQENFASYSPGLFVVGEVTAFAHDYAWHRKLPLAGQRVVVTRSLSQSSTLADMLIEQGADVRFLPTIAIEPLPDLSELEEAIQQINRYSWIIFTSVNAVEIFFDRLYQMNFDARHLASCKMAVVGPATARALKTFGVQADFMPAKHTAQALVEELLAQYGLLTQTEVLMPASAIAHTAIADGLQYAGVKCRQIAVYENKHITYQRHELEELLSVKDQWLTFCSSSAVDNFMSLIQAHGLSHLLTHLRIGVIGEVTAASLQAHGLNYQAMPVQPLVKNLVEEIIQITTNHKA